MAALNMQGEHHVNTFLCQKKKKKSARTLLFHASLSPLFDSLLAKANFQTQARKQDQKQNANGEAMRCKARPLQERKRRRRRRRNKTPSLQNEG